MDRFNENKEESPEGKNDLVSSNGFSVDPLPLVQDYRKESSSKNTAQNRNRVLISGETQPYASGINNSSMGLNLQTDNGNNNTELHHDPTIRTLSKEADSVKSFVDKNCENIQTEVIPSLKAQSPVDSFNNFSSTFMLDEELELEQNTARNPFTMERVDDEDDEIRVDDQAVERLVIVTQSNRTGEAPGEKSETISSELASAINDGLYFYEKELNLKRSHHIHNKPSTESREENSSCSANDASLPKSRIFDHSTTGSSCEGPGHSNSKRKHKKGSSKPHSSHRQRLFPGNFRTHG